jgi:hypothetical protein
MNCFHTRKKSSKPEIVSMSEPEVIVTEDKVPIDIRKTKAYGSALKALGEAPAAAGATTAASAPAAPAQSNLPKKGDTKAVQGGTAVFDGTKWVMKQ